MGNCGVNPELIKYLAHYILEITEEYSGGPELPSFIKKSAPEKRMDILCYLLWNHSVLLASESNRQNDPVSRGSWHDQVNAMESYIVPEYDPVQFLRSLDYYISHCDLFTCIPTRDILVKKLLEDVQSEVSHNIVADSSAYINALEGAPPSKVTQQASSIDQ